MSAIEGKADMLIALQNVRQHLAVIDV